MLDESRIRQILDQLPRLTIAVVGDFFLDKYLDIDGRLTEQSLETGLDAYQVAGVRTSPGAGGTVTNNLASLGVGRILALTVIGVDGEGFELKRELAARRVDLTHVIESTECRTPTYTKPMLGCDDGPARELNRLDIKNRQPMPATLVREIARRLDEVVAQADAVIVADQVCEPECGVMTLAVRERLAKLGQRYPAKVLFADSRERIGLYRNVLVKPNCAECLRAVGMPDPGSADQAADQTTAEAAARQLSRCTGRRVFCTIGTGGILVVDGEHLTRVPAFSVKGPIDIVGAGDSTTVGIVCGLCCGTSPIDAASLGNLVASITIQQLGTTGTANPDQLIDQFRAVAVAPMG